eukprot:15476109-Alexandrium_andersonii.AAC.1
MPVALRLTFPRQPRDLVHERSSRTVRAPAGRRVKGVPEVRGHLAQQSGDLLIREQRSIHLEGIARVQASPGLKCTG